MRENRVWQCQSLGGGYLDVLGRKKVHCQFDSTLFSAVALELSNYLPSKYRFSVVTQTGNNGNLSQDVVFNM